MKEKNESLVFEPRAATDALKSFGPPHNEFPCMTYFKVKLAQPDRGLILGHLH